MLRSYRECRTLLPDQNICSFEDGQLAHPPLKSQNFIFDEEAGEYVPMSRKDELDVIHKKAEEMAKEEEVEAKKQKDKLKGIIGHFYKQ